VKAFPLAVAEWTLESLALADDDASAKYCSVAYVFHDACPPWAFVCLGVIALA